MNDNSSNDKQKPAQPGEKTPMGTREFKQRAYAPKPITFRRRAVYFYENNRSVFFTLLGLFAVLAFFVFMGLRSFTSKTDIQSEIENRENRFWMQEPINDTQLIRAILEQNFGTGGPEFVRSLRLNGSITMGAEALDFYMLKRRPHSAILKLNLGPGVDLTYGIKDQLVWARLRQRELEEVYEVKESEAEGIRLLANFFSPFVEFVLSQSPTFTEVALSDDLGYQAVKLSFYNTAKECDSNVYLSVDDLSVIQRIDHIAAESNERTVYSDYRIIDGVKFPFNSKKYIGDKLTQEIRLEEVAVNPGIISSLFDVPAEIGARAPEQ